MRILPTYWVALACGVVALFLSAAFWSRAVPYSALDYFANFFLITDFFGRIDIPSVMWTLMIEIKFYLLAPLFYWLRPSRHVSAACRLERRSSAALLRWRSRLHQATSSACWGHRGFISRVAWEPMLIGYMLIGIVFYAHFRGLVSGLAAALGGIAFLFGLFRGVMAAVAVRHARQQSTFSPISGAC